MNRATFLLICFFLTLCVFNLLAEGKVEYTLLSFGSACGLLLRAFVDFMLSE